MTPDVMQAFIQYGALGVMCAFLGGVNVWMVKKAFAITENNTKALGEVKGALNELKGVIDKCQVVHRYIERG